MKVALITGITGQTGSYLAELLLSKGYEVHGVVRRSSSFNTGRIDHIFDRLHLHHGDMADAAALGKILRASAPDEIYNLAAQSHVRVSFDMPEYTGDVIALGTIRLLEAMRDVRPQARYYQASSSELFGNRPPPQDEATPFQPRSPYAAAKAYAYWMTVNYREAYGFHASNGILFNHEGPRRGETFVTRKITKAAARIKLGLQKKIVLGNLDSKRDWGFAGDYADAIWRMLQKQSPGDYVIATGETHSVRTFLKVAFEFVDLDYREFVEFDPRYARPSEVDVLQGNAWRARCALEWEPRVRFRELVKMMVDADLEAESRKGV